MSRKRNGQCRFCLDVDSLSNLISPCECKGSCKYVHNTCLINWYQHRPDRGFVCGTCQQPLAKRPMDELEDLVFVDCVFYEYRILDPLSTVFLEYTILTVIVFIFYPFYIETPLWYHCIFQGCLHIYYSQAVYMLLKNVKNLKKYSFYWRQPSRYSLFFLHGFFLSTCPVTYGLGGIGASICLFLYFYEHYEILEDMNRKNTITFISKPTLRRLRQERPSLADHEQ